MARRTNEGDNVTNASEASIEGVDVERVTEWLGERVPTMVAPLTFSLITGGHSNLTFTVTDTEGRRWVLRRPPLKQVLATAHDMGREFRILSALQPTDVPVPPLVDLCTEETTNGAPFYVMDHVDGRVIRNIDDANGLDLGERATASHSLIDVLARIHAVDIDAAGLADFAKRDDYIARQLHRWNGQFEKSKTRDLPVMDEVFNLLQAATPAQGPATIVHGDYRLDNCMLGPDGSVMAVLDWEICTLGDPLADVGLLVVYWGDADGPTPHGAATPTAAEGFLSKNDLLEAYSTASGRDVDGIEFYVAFGFWKLACIVEGVYARYVGGAMGQRNVKSFDFFDEQVVALADAARAALGHHA